MIAEVVDFVDQVLLVHYHSAVVDVALVVAVEAFVAAVQQVLLLHH